MRTRLLPLLAVVLSAATLTSAHVEGARAERDRAALHDGIVLKKLDTILGVMNDPSYETQDLGQEGLDVLKTWERMDEGELEFDDALKQASGGQKEKDEENEEEAEAST